MASGEFRPLPIDATASLVQAVIDGVMLQWVFDEKAIDLRVAGAEVVEMLAQHAKNRSKEKEP